MNTKTNRRPLVRLMAVLMALAMVVSVVFVSGSADKANFTAPTSATNTKKKNWVTVAAHSQGWITPEVLGLTNTTSRARELPVNSDGSVGMTLEAAQQTAALGVFGSDINEEPNPYHYNYFYNTYAAANNLTPAPFPTYTLSKDIDGSPAMAAASGGYTKYGTTVPASFYLEPDILIGVGTRTESSGGYTAALNTYNEAKLAADPTLSPYEPVEVVYEMSKVYSFLKTLYDLADVTDEIKAANPTKVTRYEDPQIIAGDVEKYVKGLEAYVIKKLKEDNAKPLVVAVVDTSYTDAHRLHQKKDDTTKEPVFDENGDPVMEGGEVKDNEFVVNTKDCSTQGTTAYSRVGEFVADTAVNIVDAIGGLEMKDEGNGGNMPNKYYVVTADQIAQYADVVLFCDVLSSIPENTGNSKVDSFKQDLAEKCTTQANRAKVNDIEMMSSAFDCVGSIGANSVENVLGMAYYTAYLYPQYLNQFDVAAYWYQNFYHVSDLNKLKTVMASNFATSSVQDAYAKQYSAAKLNYDEQAVEDKIIEGMRYYEDNENEFKDKLIYQDGRTASNTGWKIDWTQGIGAGKREEPKTDPEPTPTPVVKQNGLADSADSNGDWWYYTDGKIDTTHNGVDQNKYGWWRVENGKVNFNAQGIYQNSFGWWKTTNGKVTFKEEGVFQNNFGWWRVKDSKVDFNAQSIYQNKFGWWKTTNGKVTFKENGLFSNQYGTWKVENSKVNFNFNGKYQGKTIKNGKVV